ncbi:putative kinase [Maudiozyma exigua]|uniref:Kinase n=1 Tax=Maudiozyma exigua TaxID=34358 RepID=A0A9P6VVL3_MAUEX|nr:putative kinase [Kazachstania exigua]
MEKLLDKIYKLLDSQSTENYRISVVIVGPPGSGKSTIAEEIRDKINGDYHKFLTNTTKRFKLRSDPLNIDLADSIPEITPLQLGDLTELNGICPSLVEDTDFQAVKNIQPKGDGLSTIVIGRGGLSNAIYIENPKTITNGDTLPLNTNIAQIVPMDGFHLSRACLDHFRDPKMAHLRRGSPPTFDSNNFAALCTILANSSKIVPKKTSFTGLFEKLSDTFYSDMPDVYIPSFDHAKKDPTVRGNLVSRFTRVLIFEGLYLLYDKENWKTVYSTLTDTGATIFVNLKVPETVLEDRVAQRHLKSGLVDTFEEGVYKFRQNDILNAREIANNTICSDLIDSIDHI